MLQYFLVLFIVLFLSLIKTQEKIKKNTILPLCFLILTVFLSIRYNYGLDYEIYADFFDNPESRTREFTEFMFWDFFYFWDSYTSFIIAHTIIWCFTLFYFVRKYLPPSYYWLFFLVLICNNNMMFNYMSALRSSLASCVFLFSTEFFYLKRKNYLLYVVGILVASFFHTSSMFMLIVPIADLIRLKINSKSISIFLVLLLIGGLFYTETVADMVVNSFGGKILEYNGYINEERIETISIVAFILNLIVLLPILAVSKHYKTISNDTHHKILFIAVLWFAIFALHLDFQGRMTMFMYLFFIIAIANNSLYKTSKGEQSFIVGCVVSYSIVRCYSTFAGLALQPGLPGNMIFYQTIFD